MGTYVPAGRKSQRSVNVALREAEEDHFLDCPTADFWVRVAAIFLDLILSYLLWTGIDRTCDSLGTYAVTLMPPPADGVEVPMWEDPMKLARFASATFRGMLIYGFFVWPVARYGGSPGKLLLGLRVLDAETGRRLGIPRVFLREILGKALSTVAGGLGWGLPLIRNDLRALHDLVSGTVVKRIHGGP